jgi:hypothetical protein
MAEIRVGSWAELQERVYAQSWREPLRRFRSPYAFRGMGDAAAGLSTSLVRLGGAVERLEGHLLRNFRKYARADEALGDSVWNWLALAQHHGLPTRMLDWTFSPQIALHFMSQQLESFHLDGVVWCVDYAGAHELLPQRLRAVLGEEQADVFTAEMLDRVARTLGELDDLGKEPFVLFVEPPSLDERIVTQFALFSMMSDASAEMDQWLVAHPDLWQKIIIPAKLKWEVRDKLDQANVTERVLFPGLDGLSLWLKRYYAPREAAGVEQEAPEDPHDPPLQEKMRQREHDP